MPYTQDQRQLALETVLGPDALLLTGLTGEEGLSRPFHLTLDLASEDRALDTTALLGTAARVTIALPAGGERTLHGLIARFRQVDARRSRADYQAELVPWLWMLSLGTDCRIFQRKSVPEIVSTVFDDLGYRDYRLRLVNAYPPREYCVQYRETHLDFVSRLLEDEGIFYYFEHEADRHVLVLADSPGTLRPCPDLPRLPGAPTADGRWPDTYTSLAVERAVRTRAVALTDYDYLHPSAPLAVSLAAQAGTGEAFDYPGGYAKWDDGDRYARLRVECTDASRETATGTSTAPALASGYRVEVPMGGGDGGKDARPWLVVAVTHSATQGSYVGGDPGAFTYENAFTLASAELPWRPPRRTPRPHVHGTQSALVVGHAGEEIWTDAHGRVKLHFYWDRRSQRDENSSCWVRCTSAWAGKGYGQFSVPRIGQEVLVDFLEGDPDRPVVVGRVFNADQPPPCDPGGSRGVVSGLRSKTHKGGGYNGIEMNDTAGKEKLSVHAQYDMDTTVQHDDTQTVVSGNRKIDVKAGTHTETIKGDTTITITTGAYKHDVQTGTATIHVKGAVAETFDAGQTTTVAHDILIDGGDSITLKSGDSAITLEKGGKITIHCKNLEVIGDVEIKASAPKVSVTGGDEAKFGVGSQQMTCDTSKVSVSGAAINASAVGTHEITGALVKIN